MPETDPFEILNLAELTPAWMEKYTCRHQQTHYEIFWLKEGAGLHKVKDLQCPLTAGIFMQSHQVRNISSSCCRAFADTSSHSQGTTSTWK